jgi:hypothetical protein
MSSNDGGCITEESCAWLALEAPAAEADDWDTDEEMDEENGLNSVNRRDGGSSNDEEGAE